jgi:hypothetical protein
LIVAVTVPDGHVTRPEVGVGCAAGADEPPPDVDDPPPTPTGTSVGDGEGEGEDGANVRISEKAKSSPSGRGVDTADEFGLRTHAESTDAKATATSRTAGNGRPQHKRLTRLRA